MPWFKKLTENPAREAMSVWAGLFLVLALSKLTIGLLPWGPSLVGALAVALFLLAPTEMGRKLGRPDEDYGLDLAAWRSDLLFAFVVMAVVFPLFVAGFRGFLWVSHHWVPQTLARYLSPYGLSSGFHWRAPDDLLNRVAGNIAVALSEEFFYRGYLNRRFSEQWPPQTRLGGAPFGRAVLLQTSLFATGHLLTPDLFRLATFFPGLLFSWMASRSRRVLPSAIVHASSNLLIATLEASAFGA